MVAGAGFEPATFRL